MKADLHLHTTASDGRLTPAQLVQRAAQAGLEVMAITDHDSVEGIAAGLEAAGEFPQLRVIPGVEISTDVENGEVHVLGYFLNYLDPHLNGTLKGLRDSRLERGRRIVAKLAGMGIEVDFKRVLELADGGAVGRPHVAQAMLERGHINTLKDAFTKYIGRSGPAYVPRKKVSPLEAVILVAKAGGLPVLAHPADVPRLEDFVVRLRKAGIVGMEVYYNGYAPDTVSRMQVLAAKYDLIPCGGSDYHGPGGTVGTEIGSVDVPRESIERLFALAGK